MNTIQAIDFARHIIPWVQEHTTLKRNKEWPLPTIKVLRNLSEFIAPNMRTETPMELRCHLMATGAYSPEINTLLLCHADECKDRGDETSNRVYRESIVVHELVHYLQAANGMFKSRDKIAESEVQAYAAQAHYVQCQGVDPALFNLTPEKIMIQSGMAAKLGKNK